MAAGAGLLPPGANNQVVQAAEKRDDGEKEVGAVEDLMREHGVVRRAILVYRDAAVKPRAKPAGVDPELLRRTALMFRAFGEDYHEKKLEEAHIFPTIKKSGGPAAAYVDVLIVQHQRGRGKDGFEDAVAQIAHVEQALGIADIAQFTASPPPKA